MIYKVTCYHHRKAIIRGDVEAETVIESCKTFKTKKAVVSYLLDEEASAKRRGNTTRMSNKRGEMPELIMYTNNTWVHENTGEREKEYYWYKTEKV